MQKSQIKYSKYILQKILRIGFLGLFVGILQLQVACDDNSCLKSEDENCVIPSPCEKLNFECSSNYVSARVIRTQDELPKGMDAKGGVGDILLENDHIQIVIESLDNSNFFATSGGFILDMVTKGDDNDSIPHIEQVTGFLPNDAIVYKSVRILEAKDGVQAIQLFGHLQEDPRQTVATRYELHACDRGVRVRTEIINGSNEAVIWQTADGFYWGDRATAPFIPLENQGYFHDELSVAGLNDLMYNVPFMASAPSTSPGAGYNVIGCSVVQLEGLNSAQVSVIGMPRRIVAPNDYEVYERFLGVSNGEGASHSVNQAFEVRRQLFGEEYVLINGQITVPDATKLNANRASVYIYEEVEELDENQKKQRIPWNHAVLASDGTFSVAVPSDKTYTLEVVSFGQVSFSKTVAVNQAKIDVGTIALEAISSLKIRVNIDNQEDDAQIFFYPADQATSDKVTGVWNNNLTGNRVCSPLLGSPWTDSPACHLALIHEETTVEILPGKYVIFATHGPFHTIEKQEVELKASDIKDLVFNLKSIPGLKPNRTLSADFHVHGSHSFDTNFPDYSRVLSFMALGIDVIAATEHDAIWDFKAAREKLDADLKVKLIVGLESTGFALWNFNPAVTYGQAIGHFNFWPLEIDLSRTRGGAPNDELVEPGMIYTKMYQAGFNRQGVIQMNHPWTTGAAGRDFGFPYALNLDLTKDLPLFDDGSPEGVFIHRPQNALYKNIEYHTQEVMNGSENDSYLGYRDFWFFLLNQGIIRAGTANSDSHSLVDNTVGTPRTLIESDTTFANFSIDVFNQAVRDGQMTGTNGPIIEASFKTNQGDRGPSIHPFTPSEDMMKLTVKAAPWVPVEEIRIWANGELVKRLKPDLLEVTDPYGTTETLRFKGEIYLSEILEDMKKDTWIVVEAGAAFPLLGDLDCDGISDTSDNNDDGEVNWKDVDRNFDNKVDSKDLDLNGDGTADSEASFPICEGETGPVEITFQSDLTWKESEFLAIVEHSYPLAFTNPFVLNLDGESGFTAPKIKK